MALFRWAALVGGAVALASCSGTQTPPEPEPADSGQVGDAGEEDAGPGPLDAGAPDAGPQDGGAPPDGGVDAGPLYGGPGPWPLGNTSYGSEHGIRESPIVGTSTDETQNLWVATHQALYLLQPGQTTFKRFIASDGLHLQSNPVTYCDSRLGGGDKACPIYGAAVDPGITEIVGGGSNEVFVGYAGNDEGSADWSDPNRHTGMLDRVRLQPDGTLQVNRIDLFATNHGMQYWHNRTVQRMLFDHFIHPHELYLGMNHGVDFLRPDLFREPVGQEWPDTVAQEYLSDHLHAQVCYHRACDSTATGQRFGDWRGLALSADGHLWTAGRWSAGKIRWDASLPNWSSRGGSQAFEQAFGDPYPTAPNGEGFINEPVFRPPEEGDPVALSAVTVAPDGRVWFAGGSTYDTPPINYGIAVWGGRSFRVYRPDELGLAEGGIRDLVALPDGRLAIAGPNSGLTLWDPATGAKVVLRAPGWLRDDKVQRLELDRMVSPPALHVSTATGATVLRQLPVP